MFYGALLQAAGNALLDVGRSKLKAQLGCLTILHTWGQNLSLHPHVHCVVPGGGFSLDGTRWVSPRNSSYLLPINVLWRRFRSLLCQALRAAERDGRLERLPKNVLPHITIEGAAAQEWIAYVKPPFGGPEQVLEYLSRYTHRVAISNRRILSFVEHKVTFQWRDYSDSNRTKYSTIDALEFLRRFMLHVLPDRFVRIRYFGFLSNRHRAERIARARRLLARPVLSHFHDRPRPILLCSSCFANAAASAPRLNTVRPPPVAHHAA